jgi:pimeloyl-ACP methyl ester carboxylesterase
MKIVTGLRCDDSLSPKQQTIDAGGMTWRYLEWGDHGPPAVLWHGITSNARNWWRVGPFLAGLGFHVWAPDLPGHGLSENAPNAYSLEATARLLDEWMAALALTAPIVVGHSWGGINALVHATLPDTRVRPRALALEDPVLMLAADGEAYLPSFTVGIGVPREVLVKDLAAANPRWHACDVQWKAEAWQQVRRAAVESFFRHNAGINVVERLRQIPVPTHILVADPAKGGIWTFEHLALVQGLAAPGLTLEVIAGSSHNIHRDSFAPFSMSLGVFMRQFLTSAS